MSRTKIEWATDTWNPVTGCTKVSEGCRHCYAERMVKRFGGRVHAGDGTGPESVEFGRVILHPEKFEQPLRWRKPRRVFVCSMSDLFHPDVPDDFIDRVFASMSLSTGTFMVLTKRPARMREYMANVRRGLRNICSSAGEFTGGWPFLDGVVAAQWIARGLPNVWLGVSVENQATADERIPLLLETPATVRFVSYEPALGPVDFVKVPGFNRIGGINPSRWWVICGGESGPGARPMHPDWARSMRDQCQAAGVPFFFKQWGEWAPSYDRDRDDPDWRMVPAESSRRTLLNVAGGSGFHGERVVGFLRVGKKAAGRELDGKVWDQVPEGMP